MRSRPCLFKRLSAVLVLIGLLIGPVSFAHADGTSSTITIPKTPLELIEELNKTRENYGVLIEPSSAATLSYASRTVGSPNTTSSLCSDLTESACPRTDGAVITANLMLGKCESDADIGCIEYIEVSLAGGELKVLTYVESVVNNLPAIPQNSELNTPRGDFPSLWISPSGELYLIKFRTGFSFTVKVGKDEKTKMSGTSMNATTTAELSVSRIQIVSGTYTLPWIRTMPMPADPTRNNIAWNTGSCGSRNFSTLTSCYQTIPFEPQTRIKATVRLPKSVSGWMHGRINNPTISSSQTTNGQMRYQIEGDISPTYIAGGMVPSTAPPELLSQQLRNLPIGHTQSREPGGAISHFNALEQYIGNSALTTQNLWVVQSSSSINPSYIGAAGAENCMQQISGFVGIVSTNAAAYDSQPPVWDSANGVLTYNVASPHLDENGAEAVGNYSLAIPPLVAQCLYGDSALPASVPIEVVYSDVATPLTQTTTITRDENWVRFTASGFHFSSPVIKVKLGIASNPKSMTPSASVRTNTKLKTKSLSSLAILAKLKVVKGAKLTGSVDKTSKSICSITKSNILSRKKKGLCQIVLSSTKGKTVVRKVVLITFN